VNAPRWVYAVLILACLGGRLEAQIAGYRVGTSKLDLRTIPCRQNEQDQLCQPNGDIFLRVRGGILVEIDTSWQWSSQRQNEFLRAPDVWRRVQGPFVTRFGPPDSVRIMNQTRLPKAYEDGVAAFWTRRDWCGVLTVMTYTERLPVTAVIDLTIEKKGTWFIDCNVLYLAPSK
jgi:hypothetical protein